MFGFSVAFCLSKDGTRVPQSLVVPDPQLPQSSPFLMLE